MRHYVFLMLRALLLAAPVALVLAAPWGPARAQTPTDEVADPAAGGANEAELDDVSRRVRRLSDELKSPFCPGKTLLNCTSYQAFELRKEIKQMVLSGESDADITALLEARFGESKVANPPQPWYTALVPFLPFLAMGLMVLWVLRRWSSRRAAADASTPTPSAAVPAGDADRLARLRARIALDDE